MWPDQEKQGQVRVVIADDNKEMRDTVIGILRSYVDVVGVVADGREFVDAVVRLKPEVGIVDISMPILNGISAVSELQELGPTVKFVILTVHEDRDFVRAAFESGASAYVIKRQMGSDLRNALTEVLAGRTFVSPGCDFSELINSTS